MFDAGKNAEIFSEYFQKLVSAMAVIDNEMDFQDIHGILTEMSVLLNLSKGVTRVYENPINEQLDRGETIISFDTGKPGRPVHTVRFERKLLSIVTMTVYMADDAPPLSDIEFEKLDLVLRLAVTFISRNLVRDNIQRLAFFDDQGFRNIRSFFRYITWHGNAGDFDGMAAINYNLQHFSLINSEQGRDAGDMVLTNHYKYVEGLVGEKGIISRLGGDSFVCIIPQDKLKDLLKYFNQADVVYDKEGHTRSVSARAGIFKIPDGFKVNNLNEIMGKILYACHIAQTGGHDPIVFYDEKLIENRELSMRIQQQFPEAMRNQEFRVFFQPKVDTVTGELAGAEALSRWLKDGEILSPEGFVPILEQTSDICKLDFYVLDRVCGFIRKWLDEGRKVVRISVNFSRKHFINEKLHEKILEIVDKHNVPHEYIEIELTETTTDVEFRALKSIVKGLQANHIRTSVDDFGMGYSSLNLIRVIPWNVIKIDRSFLPKDNESADSISHIMFRNVVNMTREMGLETVAEGVETAAQLHILQDNNCELAQGFLFDRALPAEEFEKRLDAPKYDTYR